MKKLLLGLLAGAVVALTAPISSWAQCPNIGAATGCDVIITLSGSPVSGSAATTGQPAYDGVEDQLVGVVNNSTSTVLSMVVTGSKITNFDSDGAASSACYAGSGTPPNLFGCPFSLSGGVGGANGYQGPLTTFSGFTDPGATVTVTFNTPLAPGATAWFSLEEPPTVGALTVQQVTPAPEPASMLLFGSGLLGLGGFLRRRFSNR